MLSSITFQTGRDLLMKNDLAVLGIIAANNWNRPIYFTNPSTEGLGLDSYLRRDGMTYRLVPIANEEVNPDWMIDKVMNKFTSGNANIKGVYFDEENRRHLNNIRQAYADLGNYLGTHNRKAEGRQVLNKMDALMLQDDMPYGMTSRYNMQNRTSLMALEASYRNEDTALIGKISNSVKKDLNQQMEYYAALGGMSRQELEGMLKHYNDLNQANRNNGEADYYIQSSLQNRQIGMASEIVQAYSLLQAIAQMESMFGKQAAPSIETMQPNLNNRPDSQPADNTSNDSGSKSR